MSRNTVMKGQSQQRTMVVTDYRKIFLEILESTTDESDTRWRTLSSEILARGPLVEDLIALFQTILDFDAVFSSFVANPLAIPEDAVIVSGSGKESFKTFNVSTVAAILAASAGVKVVKGVSRSVSSISGSLDILTHFGIIPVTVPAQVGPTLETAGIVFVDYRTFCPSFFRRYDGLSAEIQATSLFMPVAALPVVARGFVHGLASPLSEESLHIIRRVNPRMPRGIVVGAELAPGMTIDELVHRGRYWQSHLIDGAMFTEIGRATEADNNWLKEVAHRNNHSDNASVVLSMLTGRASPAVNEIVYDNAALIIQVGVGVPYGTARSLAIAAHTSGQAIALFRTLTLNVWGT